jgi:tetratricopeptide (TPR) repeat protein
MTRRRKTRQKAAGVAGLPASPSGPADHPDRPRAAVSGFSSEAASAPAGPVGRRRGRRPPSLLRLSAFAAVTVVLLLALVEGGLRLAGFGGMPRLFEPVLVIGSQQILRISNRGVGLFFGVVDPEARRTIGSMVDERLTMPKPPATVRVFMIGESTVQGFPYPPNLCAAAILQAYLQERLPPGQRAEVVNLGVTAIASYPLRYLASEALRLGADLLVVYAGHNEYYGAFGVASRQGAGTRPWQMAASLGVRRTALYQALATAAQRAATAAGETAAPRGTLMSRMFAREFISPDDPLRERAKESLDASVRDIIKAAQSARGPGVLCSLASNLRDLEPVRTEGDDPSVRETIERLLRAGDPSQALAVAERWARAQPRSAAAAFARGRVLEAAGRTTEALEAFRLARDLDAMPWRGSSALNDCLARAAADHGDAVVWCDIAGAFEAYEPTAGPGWRLFTDHLHPSLEGQALMAWTILEAVASRGLVPGLRARPCDDWTSTVLRLGANPLIEYNVARRMATLFGDAPFERHENARRHWERDAALRFEALQPFERRAAEAHVKRVAAEGDAGAGSLSLLGGREAFADGHYDRAAAYCMAALNETPQFSPRRSEAAYYYFLSRRLGGAPPAADARGIAEAILEAEATEKALNRGREPLLRALAGLNALAGRGEAARRWLDALGAGSAGAEQLRAELALVAAAGQTTATVAP